MPTRRRRLDRGCPRSAAVAVAAATNGSAAFLLSPAPAVLAIPEPDPIPGGPTAYGGTKPGADVGGGGEAGIDVATVPAGAGTADGAVVGALGAPIATGVLDAAGIGEA